MLNPPSIKLLCPNCLHNKPSWSLLSFPVSTLTCGFLFPHAIPVKQKNFVYNYLLFLLFKNLFYVMPILSDAPYLI